MTVINPSLLLGNVAVEASSLIHQDALASLPVADSYTASVARLPPMASPQDLPIESAVLFTTPSLAGIHRAGVGADPEKLLAEFPEVRRLKNGRTDALALLWREHDDEVEATFGQYVDPEYLDPENPLRWNEDAAELSNLPMRYRKEVIALHHALRRSLAEEQSFTVTLRKNIRYEIRYRLIEGPAPVRDGTVAVDLAEIGALLDRFEGFVKPIGSVAKARLIRGLVVIGAIRGYQEARGWAQPLTIASIVERVLPHWSDAAKKRAIFFQTVLEASKANVPLVPNGTAPATYWEIYKGIAAALDHPTEEMLRQVLGPAVERWKQDGDLRMDFLRDFLALGNFLGLPEPWRLLWRLHRDELSWAFARDKKDKGRILFGIDPDTDLELLREHGFGGLLNAARIERGWNLPALREAVVAVYGADVSLERLGAIAANREQPDFKILKALVEALNRHPEAMPIDRSEAFLATYPTFIDLLPLGARGEERILREPAPGPVSFVPYARPADGASLIVTGSDTMVPADPEGFPALIRLARGLRRLTVTAAAERLGIAANTLRQYELNPEEGERSLPGRLTLSVVCSPKGYGLAREKALESFLHTYWEDKQSVQTLRGRSFTGPVFIEENALTQIQAYAAAPRTTPGELLFFWRNGVPPNQDVPFLATQTEMAAFLGVPLASYRNWESNAFAPSPGQAEAVARLLGRSDAETLGFREACAALRAERLASLPVSKSAPFPHLAAFAASLAFRPFFLKANVARFYAKLKSLYERNPSSVHYLESRLGAESPGSYVLPDSVEAARLISAVHHADEKARLCPDRIALTGPIAAYTYHQYKKGKKASDRLTRAMRNPRVSSVTFSEDGSCHIEGLGPRGKPKARVKFAPQVPSEDVPVLTSLIHRMKAERRLNNQSRTKAFLGRLACLAEHDPVSYRDFVAAATPSADLNRLCNALELTARFIERWKGRFTWSGSVFRYYDALRGKRAALMFLRNRLARGNLRAVHFDGSQVSFEALNAPRRPSGRSTRRGGDARTFSYADAKSVRFLPHPKNQWGRRDLSASWSDVQARVRSFFERLETDRGELPVAIQRVLGRTYYNIRSGADVLGGEYLSDEVLDRLGLNAEGKEELRHLQALLLLSRGEGQEREEGPYADIARVLRYYRLLHQMTLAEAKPFYRGGPAVAGPADYELGRLVLTDEARLHEVAKGIGVPASFRRELVSEMVTRYAAKQKKRSLGGLIPHGDWSEKQTLEALKALAVEARGRLSRGDFARATGVTASHLYKFENFGEISEDAWPLYQSHLQSDGQEALAQRIRTARAVLDLRRKPTETDGGYAEAGGLLRFTRCLMIGTSTAQVMKDMNLAIDPQLYLRWEWGFNRMPDSVLDVYSRLLVRRGVLTAKEAGSFAAKIREIYRT